MIPADYEDVESIEVGELRLIPDERVAVLGEKRIFLTPKEFQLLVMFARNPGRLLRRDRISAEVWEGAARGRTIDIHVARLRSHLPTGAIETVIRLGYRFQMG